jgi:oligopeptide/dipeptide ABC transporter ATP-binding protein
LNDSPLLRVTSLKIAIRTREKDLFPVNSVSFHINKGECVCLVGESGCGKSVTALSLMGLLPSPPFHLAGGEIFFKDLAIHAMSSLELQDIRGRHMAMIFQEPMTALNPVFTIGEQIAEAVNAHFSFSPEETRKKTLAALEMAEMPDPGLYAASYPHQLSGGMRQRAMIAMALACTPSLLIADEPTTALDVSTQDQILQLMNSLREKNGLSLLFITHNMGVVAQIAQRVMIMYAGRLVEISPVEEFFTKPRHPYSKALLDSIPKYDSISGQDENTNNRKERLSTIPGNVPSLEAIPSGCPFHDRCPNAMARCSIETPLLMETGRDTKVACHLYSSCR